MHHLQNLCKAAHEFLQEATKVSLLLSIFVVSISYLAIVFCNLNNQQVVIGVKELSGSIFLLIVGFYFGQKGLPAAPPPNTANLSGNVDIKPIEAAKPVDTNTIPNET